MPDSDPTNVVPDSQSDARANSLVPPPPSGAPAGEAPSMPSAIGRYRILRLLGEGGMGAVYEAEQETPHRTVALKIIRTGYANAEMLRRFETETQALGRLQHPGIAQIYDAGTEETPRGRQPYIAMELVHGETLLAYCDQHKLKVRKRLDLFAKICDAVQHAHQRGLIHRDLKPANILVSDDGQPKILDFGTARLTDSDAQATRQTSMGQIIGTLAYMSPEQVTGEVDEIDTRSDVYTLGVILYELLAGRLPYETGRRIHEAISTIREKEPSALRTINRAFRGDVETIVARALEKDKTRRYGSAAELAADVRRYLHDEPIMARPPSTAYQLRKFARRNKALVTGVAAVFVVLVGGVVASTWEAVQARRAEKKALQETAIAHAVNDFLQHDLLAQASAYNQSKPDPNITVRTVLDRAAQNIQGKFNNQPAVEAAIRDTIGRTYLDMGLYPEAQRQLERALALERRTLGPEDPGTIETMIHLGDVADRVSNFSEAEAVFKQTLATANRVLGPDNADTLNAAKGLANAYFHQGKFALAQPLYNRVLQSRRRVLGPENPDTLMAMNNLAADYSAEGKNAEAETLFSQVADAHSRVLGPDHPDTLLAVNNLANVYVAEGKYVEGEALLSRNIEARRRTLGPEHPDTVNSMFDLANAYLDQGKYAQAEPLFRQVYETRRLAFGPEHISTLLALSGLAVALDNQGHYAQAEPLFRQIEGTMRRVLGPEDIDTLWETVNLGEAYEGLGKYDLARTYEAQALAGLRRVQRPEYPETLTAEADLALDDVSLGDCTQAEPLAREVLEKDKKVQPDDVERFFAESMLGACLTGEKKYAEAEPLLLEGYQGMVTRKARMLAVPDLRELDRAREWIVELYRASGKPEKAIEWKKK
ncbi:MAG TPA: serine/threonine-protein kinase [Acidobacteriaceae bacterium]|nr:serine/threonine-protein kinase [Acidobacteriaceae bacterium]